MKFKFNDSLFYLIVFLLITLMLIQIEWSLNKKYAPESVLVRVLGVDKQPEQNASCNADIISNQINVNDKSLKGLESIYDYVEASIWNYQKGDKGFYLLETGFLNYDGDYEIKVVCISQGNRGVSYTVVDSKNKTSSCEFKDNGRFLVC